MAPVLGYWNIRGLAQPIRFMLHYVGQEFEEKKYECGPPPDYDRSSWLDEKFTLNLDFPNLPYYIDGDVKLTQSGAINRYLADKHNLLATKPEEKARMFVTEYQISDVKNDFVRLCYNPNFDQLKEDYLKALPNTIKALSNFLGKHKWFAGETLTYVDFSAYETLVALRAFKADCLDDFTNLKEYLDRFEALPAIAEYMKNEKDMKLAFHNKSAKFGNK